ncbi:hypothetical protein, partial [Thiolapillus sp.]|uniref:hypothetical protein n=1 Tax=Thiolapillus sp. TaxID=2017437 RepID=UPI003AF726DE
MPVFGAILAQVFGGIPLKTSRNLIIRPVTDMRHTGVVIEPGVGADVVACQSPTVATGRFFDD